MIKGYFRKLNFFTIQEDLPASMEGSDLEWTASEFHSRLGLGFSL